MILGSMQHYEIGEELYLQGSYRIVWADVLNVAILYLLMQEVSPF